MNPLPNQSSQLTIDESLAMIDRSIKEVQAGQGKDCRQAIRDIANSLGLQLNR